MKRLVHIAVCLLLLVAWMGGAACRLRRPDTIPPRTIEPQLVEPESSAAHDPGAAAVRLVQTQARGHIGRRVLHQGSDGELFEDPVWRWANAPHLYLDSAIRMELSSNPRVRLVDGPEAAAMSVTLLSWHLDSGKEPRLVGSLELDIIWPDRAGYSAVLRESEPVSADLPGNVAVAAGRLLQRLAAASMARVPRTGAAR
jgi:hypothetical protein